MHIVFILIIALIVIPVWLLIHWQDPNIDPDIVARHDDISVVMTLRPMLGIHSDWHRTLTITDGSASLETGLDPDTGWWRGSNLYVTQTGDLLLHEGQAGCILIRTVTIERKQPDHPICKEGSLPDGDAPQLASPENCPPKPPVSNFADDLYFLGHFSEGNRDPHRYGSFSGYCDGTEKALPPPP